MISFFWDKDIRLGKRFSDICFKADIPIYNNIQAIADCDDKSATYEKIWRWNDSHDGSEQIKMIPTVVAPMTYENIGYTSFDFSRQGNFGVWISACCKGVFRFFWNAGVYGT